MMELIKQPHGSSLCGQCVVAMLAGKKLDEVVEIMGDGRNYPPDIRKALKKFGVFVARHSEPAADGRGPLGVPAAALLYAKIGEHCLPSTSAIDNSRLGLHTSRASANSYTHWICWDGKKWLDPRGHVLSDYRSEYDAVAAVYTVLSVDTN